MGEVNVFILLALLAHSANCLNFRPKPVRLESFSCWKYQCASWLTGNTCVSPVSSNQTYLLNPCNPDSTKSYCNNTDFTSIVTCSKPSTALLSLSYPGEPCSVTSDCKYGNCYNKFCFGGTLNTACSTSLQCNPGLRCAASILNTTFVCTTLLRPGQECQNDYECIASAGCNNSTCVEYLSLAVGKIVTDCNDGDSSSMFCADSSCYYNYTLGLGYCVSPFVTDLKSPYECTSYLLCTGKSLDGNGKVISKVNSCDCGNGPDGKAYCFPQDGDLLASTFRNYWKSFMDAGLVDRCNTMRRFEQPCFDLSSSSYRYTRLMNAYYQYFYYPEIVSAVACVKEIMYPSYLSTSAYLLVTFSLLFLYI